MKPRERYFYYNSGVLHSMIEVCGTSVYLQTRNTETLQWSEAFLLTKENTPYEYPLDIDVLEAVKWLGLQVERLGEKVQPWQRVCGEVNGKRIEGQIWAQKRGALPLDYLAVEGKVIGIIGILRKKVSVLIRQGYEALTPLRDYEDPLLSKPRYGLRRLAPMMVPMRDGVKLAADVILPTGLEEGERVPAILIRTCYGRDRECVKYYFANYGYALVVQDTRGREDSEGAWSPIVNEMEDGEDTLNWIAAQPWCSGDIGMIGGSYLAIVQWAAAANQNPHLKAMVSQVTGGSPIFDFPFRNGVLCSGTLAWLFSMSERRRDPELMERDDWAEVLKVRPIQDIPKKALGREIPCWNEWMAHEYMDDYWKRADWEAYGAKIDVPTLYVSGWFDDVGAGTCQLWRMNQRWKRANQKMIVGPWKHQYNSSRDIHQIDYGLEGLRYDLFYQYLRWYDHFLKGIENGVEKLPNVQYYVTGENRWRESNAWPPAEGVERRCYLESGGHANTSRGDGTLAFEATGAGAEVDQYRFDPEDPAPHLIDLSENECMVPENYREVELREDVLVYTSSPLERDLVIAGEPKAVLYADSSAKDTDWVVRVTEVDLDGNSIRLSDGLIRARLRESLEYPTWLTPGEVVRYEIDMSWIGARLAAGKRIRVEVTSGAENSIFPNHNTGNPIATDTEYQVAQQTVYHSRKYPSHIVLPVLE